MVVSLRNRGKCWNVSKLLIQAEQVPSNVNVNSVSANILTAEEYVRMCVFKNSFEIERILFDIMCQPVSTKLQKPCIFLWVIQNTKYLGNDGDA